MSLLVKNIKINNGIKGYKYLICAVPYRVGKSIEKGANNTSFLISKSLKI